MPQVLYDTFTGPAGSDVDGHVANVNVDGSAWESPIAASTLLNAVFGAANGVQGDLTNPSYASDGANAVSRGISIFPADSFYMRLLLTVPANAGNFQINISNSDHAPVDLASYLIECDYQDGIQERIFFAAPGTGFNIIPFDFTPSSQLEIEVTYDPGALLYEIKANGAVILVDGGSGLIPDPNTFDARLRFQGATNETFILHELEVTSDTVVVQTTYEYSPLVNLGNFSRRINPLGIPNPIKGAL